MNSLVSCQRMLMRPPKWPGELSHAQVPGDRVALNLQGLGGREIPLRYPGGH